MPDFETKLRWLSERGNPVGAEELIERIEADLAGDPLVVVAKRREGKPMTKTQQSPKTSQPSRSRGPAWGVAAFVAVLAVAALYLAFADDSQEVADTDPTPTTVTPTTVAPDLESMTDLEVIEAGVAALYSGDADRAADLFELPGRDDDQIRQEAAYQAAIAGRLTLDCRGGDGGVFICNTPYHNAMTRAIGKVDLPGDRIRAVVEDGVIREFSFPEHSGMLAGMGTFLAMEGRFDGYEDCVNGGETSHPQACGTIQMENVDAWAAWRETFEPATLVEFALESWYGGDCVSARQVSTFDGRACSLIADTASQTIEYESILGAEVSLDGCEETTATNPEFFATLSCEVRYSNAMNTAVGKPPSVTVRGFSVSEDASIVAEPGGDNPWYATDYPEDTELRESFTLFAESGELHDAYAAADCASARTPECANLIIDSLDEWAAWYDTST